MFVMTIVTPESKTHITHEWKWLVTLTKQILSCTVTVFILLLFHKWSDVLIIKKQVQGYVKLWQMFIFKIILKHSIHRTQ